MVGAKTAKAKTYCCVAGCLNNDKDRSLSFHSFPKDIEKCRVWLSLINREDLLKDGDLKRFRHNARVCSIHFEDSAFYLIKHINHDAVPTLRLPNQLQEESSEDESSEKESSEEETANSIGTQFNSRTSINKAKKADPSCGESSTYSHWAMLTDKIKEEPKSSSNASSPTAELQSPRVIKVKSEKSDTAIKTEPFLLEIEVEPLTSDRTRKRKLSYELEEVKVKNQKLDDENKRIKKELEELRATLKKMTTKAPKICRKK